MDQARRQSLAMHIVKPVQTDVALDPQAAEMKAMGEEEKLQTFWSSLTWMQLTLASNYCNMWEEPSITGS